MSSLLIPASGDFDAWAARHATCLAVDWDGTCIDTMAPKWTRGFNLAVTEVWPALRPYQRQVDEVCYRVNIVEPTAGVQRFVSLMHMMRIWRAMGLPAPDLEAFFLAVEHVEAAGEQHGTATYRRLQAQFGYDDTPLEWSDAADRHIALASRDVLPFDGCRETLEALRGRADLVVVSASKTEAVRDDLERCTMTDLFVALCAQDFLPKRGTLAGLRTKYERTLFVGDTRHDVEEARSAGVPLYLVRTGDEAASWRDARGPLERFIDGRADIPELTWP